MKTQQKQQINNLPQVTLIEKTIDIKFREGYVPFAEKIANAKESLSKMKYPEGFDSK
jgi:hypothetical protein